MIFMSLLVSLTRAEIHGPSCVASSNIVCFLMTSMPVDLRIDTVPCVRCLEWPTQAADWPTRHRNYGWPDSATVDRVVSNGCDVVGVAHALCKVDDWMSKHQWRLSFSRAEVVLLNSWIPVQQILYHMLRIFMKTGRLRDSANYKSTISNYHIKTLMLWACEVKPLDWWTGGSTLVSLCMQLLQLFEHWLTKMNGQHYFINNVHFLHYFDTFTIDTFAALVNSTTESCLTRWFVDNYVRKCAELCPDNISLLYTDVVTSKILPDIVSRILKWRDHISYRVTAKRVLCTMLNPLTLVNFRSWDAQLVDIGSLLSKPILSSPDLFLQSIMSTLVRGGVLLSIIIDALNCDNIDENYLSTKAVIDYLSFITQMECCSANERRQFQCTSSNKCSSLSALSTAGVWMKLFGSEYPNNHQLAQIELAKAYLSRALRYIDSDSDSFYGLANVYLAVLCYVTGQHQKATDHCTLLTRSLGHSQSSSHVVAGKVLPKIDDNIDTVLGLAALYQYVRTTTLKQRQQTQNVSVFTTEMFAHYFNIKHLLVAKCRLAPKAREKHVLQAVEFYLCEEMTLFQRRIVSTPRLFVTDLMLCKFTNNSSINQISRCTITNTGHYNKQQLVELLTQLSMEQLLTCRQLLLPKVIEIAAISKTSDFMALLLYRCRLYERCIQLCQRTVFEIINGHVRRISRLSFMYHEFVRLMDDDIASLIGMTVLVNESKVQLKTKEPVSITQPTLLLYLLTRCRMKTVRSNQMKTMCPTHLTSDISSLADVLDLIGEAQKLKQLILKLTERLAVMFITDSLR